MVGRRPIEVFVGAARVLVHNVNGPCIPRINLQDLPAAEQQEINNTLTHIANNTVPQGPAGVNWEVTFQNRPLRATSIPELPFSPNPNYYHEYRVILPGMQPGQNVLRVVTGSRGEVYYTWSHYGTAKAIPGPPFVRLR